MRIYHHFPWMLILFFGLGFQWFWWIDTAIRPAVRLDVESVKVVSQTRSLGGFVPGDTVTILGRGENLRSCPRTYQRLLKRPDGVMAELPDGKGVRFIPGEEGWVQIEIDTADHWPPGEYEFISYGFFSCNGPLFPKQILPGITAKFTLN